MLLFFLTPLQGVCHAGALEYFQANYSTLSECKQKQTTKKKVFEPRIIEQTQSRWKKNNRGDLKITTHTFSICFVLKEQRRSLPKGIN